MEIRLAGKSRIVWIRDIAMIQNTVWDYIVHPAKVHLRAQYMYCQRSMRCTSDIMSLNLVDTVTDPLVLTSDELSKRDVSLKHRNPPHEGRGCHRPMHMCYIIHFEIPVLSGQTSTRESPNSTQIHWRGWISDGTMCYTDRPTIFAVSPHHHPSEDDKVTGIFPCKRTTLKLCLTLMTMIKRDSSDEEIQRFVATKKFPKGSAVFNNSLHLALEFARWFIAYILHKKGARLWNTSPLLPAMIRRIPSRVLERLNDPETIDKPCRSHLTQLHNAVLLERWDFVYLLLDLGASVDVGEKCPPLHYAMHRGAPIEIIKVLMSPKTIRIWHPVHKTFLSYILLHEQFIPEEKCDLLEDAKSHGLDFEVEIKYAHLKNLLITTLGVPPTLKVLVAQFIRRTGVIEKTLRDILTPDLIRYILLGHYQVDLLKKLLLGDASK